MPGRSLLSLMLVTACAPLFAQETAAEGKRLFETYCAACHSLELPMSQHLDRNTWGWVLDDMTTKFGCPVGATEKQLILDYLVENHGPER